jgi:hypothetical protein
MPLISKILNIIAMSVKKDRRRKKFSDKNPSANTTRGRSSPEKLSDENRHEGYDEERTSYNTTYESDYDVDENDINQRSDEYKDYDRRNPEKNSGNH